MILSQPWGDGALAVPGGDQLLAFTFIASG